MENGKRRVIVKKNTNIGWLKFANHLVINVLVSIKEAQFITSWKNLQKPISKVDCHFISSLFLQLKRRQQQHKPQLLQQELLLQLLLQQQQQLQRRRQRRRRRRLLILLLLLLQKVGY